MLEGPMLLLVVLVTILISMTLHEAMHAFTSYWLGDDTAKLEGRLTLNPMKHIDPFLTVLFPLFLAMMGGPIFGAAKPVPFNPYRVRHGEYGAALVGIAGPLTNLLFAILAAGMIHTFEPSGIVLQSMVTFLAVNVGFFVFNMIPWPPLDGSRLLYAFAPEPLQRVMRQIEQFGVMGLFLLLLVGLPLISPLLVSINSYIFNTLLAGL